MKKILIVLFMLTFFSSLIYPQSDIKFRKRGNQILVTLDVINYPVKDLLALIAKEKKMDLIFSTAVSGNFTGRMTDMPIDSLLSIILRSNALDFEKMGNIYRIDTMSNIQTYRKKTEEVAKAGQDIEPLETRIVRINYADLRAIMSNIQKILSPRGTISMDDRTKKLIITDIPGRFNTVYKFIEAIDIPTKQVLIKVRFVQISHNDLENIEFYWRASNTVDPSADPQVTTGSFTGTSASSPSTGAGIFNVGIVKNIAELDAVLNMLASTNKAEVRSHPQILAMNNEKAVINIGNKIPLRMVDERGELTTQLTNIGTQIEVTPQITATNAIILKIKPEVSSIAGQFGTGVLIDTNQVNTQVMLRNKETAVIGGLVRAEDTESKAGIPILSDIPIIGTLFRSRQRGKNRLEILILVTPIIQED